jgi:hypothetical protein
VTTVLDYMHITRIGNITRVAPNASRARPEYNANKTRLQSSLVEYIIVTLANQSR